MRTSSRLIYGFLIWMVVLFLPSCGEHGLFDEFHTKQVRIDKFIWDIGGQASTAQPGDLIKIPSHSALRVEVVFTDPQAVAAAGTSAGAGDIGRHFDLSCYRFGWVLSTAAGEFDDCSHVVSVWKADTGDKTDHPLEVTITNLSPDREKLQKATLGRIYIRVLNPDNSPEIRAVLFDPAPPPEVGQTIKLKVYVEDKDADDQKNPLNFDWGANGGYFTRFESTIPGGLPYGATHLGEADWVSLSAGPFDIVVTATDPAGKYATETIRMLVKEASPSG